MKFYITSSAAPSGDIVRLITATPGQYCPARGAVAVARPPRAHLARHAGGLRASPHPRRRGAGPGGGFALQLPAHLGSAGGELRGLSLSLSLGAV